MNLALKWGEKYDFTCAPRHMAYFSTPFLHGHIPSKQFWKRECSFSSLSNKGHLGVFLRLPHCHLIMSLRLSPNCIRKRPEAWYLIVHIWRWNNYFLNACQIFRGIYKLIHLHITALKKSFKLRGMQRRNRRIRVDVSSLAYLGNGMLSMLTCLIEPIILLCLHIFFPCFISSTGNLLARPLYNIVFYYQFYSIVSLSDISHRRGMNFTKVNVKICTYKFNKLILFAFANFRFQQTEAMASFLRDMPLRVVGLKLTSKTWWSEVQQSQIERLSQEVESKIWILSKQSYVRLYLNCTTLPNDMWYLPPMMRNYFQINRNIMLNAILWNFMDVLKFYPTI